MGVIDLVILICLALALLWGFLTGFSKKRLSSFAMQMGILVGYLAGNPLLNLLNKTNLCSLIQSWYTAALPTTDAFQDTIAASDVTLRNSQMSTALSELHFPKFIHSFFTTKASDFSSNVSSALASSFANWTMLVVVFLFLFFLTYILIRVLFSPFWKDGSLFGEKGRSFFGRLCGAARMVFKASFSILLVLAIVSLVASLTYKAGNSYLLDWINTDLKMDDPSAFSIGKMFYNTASSFFEWISMNP